MQKTARKSTKYSRNDTSLKIGHLAKAIAHASKGFSLCKMVSLGQKLKMPKTCEKPFCKNVKVVLCKKSSKKHQMFEHRDKFENRPSRKGHSPYKGYSLCKMVSLGQKLEMPKTCEKPFYKNNKVVLCRKPLKKTLNIREMRQV